MKIAIWTFRVFNLLLALTIVLALIDICRGDLVPIYITNDGAVIALSR